jgi:hypothetical protein
MRRQDGGKISTDFTWQKGLTMRIAVETMLRLLFDDWVEKSDIQFKDGYSKSCFREEFVIWSREETMTLAKSNLIIFMNEMKKGVQNEWKGPDPFE